LFGLAALRDFAALSLVRFELGACLFALGAALDRLSFGSLRAGIEVSLSRRIGGRVEALPVARGRSAG
jgi:hypothetical protein